MVRLVLVPYLGGGPLVLVLVPYHREVVPLVHPVLVHITGGGPIGPSVLVPYHRRWSHWSIRSGPISPEVVPLVHPVLVLPYHREVVPLVHRSWSHITGGGPIGPSGPGPILGWSHWSGPGPAISPGGGPPSLWRWSHWSVWSWSHLTGRWSASPGGVLVRLVLVPYHLVVHHRMLRQHFHLLHQKHLVGLIHFQ